MRLLVTGGRNFSDKELVKKTLDPYLEKYNEALVIIQGGATGADKLARKWACDNCVTLITEFAKWKRFGNTAGLIRNRRMLALHNPDKVIAFPGNKGTRDMIKAAGEVGVLVERILP